MVPALWRILTKHIAKSTVFWWFHVILEVQIGHDHYDYSTFHHKNGVNYSTRIKVYTLNL